MTLQYWFCVDRALREAGVHVRGGGDVVTEAVANPGDGLEQNAFDGSRARPRILVGADGTASRAHDERIDGEAKSPSTAGPFGTIVRSVDRDDQRARLGGTQRDGHHRRIPVAEVE